MSYKSSKTIDNAGSGLIPSDDALQALMQKLASDKPARNRESGGLEDRYLAEVDQDEEELEEEAAEDAETAGA